MGDVSLPAVLAHSTEKVSMSGLKLKGSGKTKLGSGGEACLTIRHTFINWVDPASAGVRNCNRLSRSAGNSPAPRSKPFLQLIKLHKEVEDIDDLCGTSNDLVELALEAVQRSSVESIHSEIPASCIQTLPCPDMADEGTTTHASESSAIGDKSRQCSLADATFQPISGQGGESSSTREPSSESLKEFRDGAPVAPALMHAAWGRQTKFHSCPGAVEGRRFPHTNEEQAGSPSESQSQRHGHHCTTGSSSGVGGIGLDLGGPGAEDARLVSMLEPANSVHEVLTATYRMFGQLSVPDLALVIHTIGKKVEESGSHSTCVTQSKVSVLLDQRFQELVVRLNANLSSLDTPRILMRVVWSLGKVGADAAMASGILAHSAKLAPPMIHNFSTHELSNLLWGVARLGHGNRSMHACASRLALSIISESKRRSKSLTNQCLVNGLWAVAKMDLPGPAVKEFAEVCLARIRGSQLKDFTSQGVANSLWAVARLSLGYDSAVAFCVDIARAVESDPMFLEKFQPQELSMTLWAVARIVGRCPRGPKARPNSRRHTPQPNQIRREVDNFVITIAQVALLRIHSFQPQGLSNIAWSLATIDLAGHPAVRQCILAIAAASAPVLRDFVPQGIANICWALRRLDGPCDPLIPRFAAHAACEATRRIQEFAWSDLSGVLSGISHLHASTRKIQEVQAFAYAVIFRICQCPHAVGTQALLNTAQSSVRLGVPPQVLTPLALAIAGVFTERAANLNDIDLRQWIEVQQYCRLPGCA